MVGRPQGYSVEWNGKQLSGAELVWRASLVQDVLFEQQKMAGIEFDLNPKLIITLLDSLYGVVSGLSEEQTNLDKSDFNLMAPDNLFSLFRKALGQAYIRQWSELER